MKQMTGVHLQIDIYDPKTGELLNPEKGLELFSNDIANPMVPIKLGVKMTSAKQCPALKPIVDAWGIETDEEIFGVRCCTPSVDFIAFFEQFALVLALLEVATREMSDSESFIREKETPTSQPDYSNFWKQVLKNRK